MCSKQKKIAGFRYIQYVGMLNWNAYLLSFVGVISTDTIENAALLEIYGLSKGFLAFENMIVIF